MRTDSWIFFEDGVYLNELPSGTSAPCHAPHVNINPHLFIMHIPASSECHVDEIRLRDSGIWHTCVCEVTASNVASDEHAGWLLFCHRCFGLVCNACDTLPSLLLTWFSDVFGAVFSVPTGLTFGVVSLMRVLCILLDHITCLGHIP